MLDSNFAPSGAQKITAALFYASSSLLIMFVNKIVLSSYSFPSSNFLAFSQTIATVIFLYFCRSMDIIQFPSPSTKVLRAIFPLPLIFMANTLSGLGGTQSLNIPMFTVLRRFSILFTMIAEGVILGNVASRPVQFSIGLMIFGAAVAASNDLSFDFMGYLLIFVNNIFTALNGVVLKKKMNSKELGSWGLMFYNNIFSIPVIFVLMMISDPQVGGSVASFPYWTVPGFCVSFFLASVMGFLLNFSIFYCTKLNSALTTTVIGCLKNVFSTYLAMLFMPGYVFSWINFCGINISVFGSIVYSYVTFGEEKRKRLRASPLVELNEKDTSDYGNSKSILP